MNDYFVLFHKAIKACANKVNRVHATEKHMVFSQEKLYNDLFYWQSQAAGEEDKSICTTQISHWLNGKETVPEWIAVSAVSDLQECRDQYGIVFRRYINQWLFLSDERESLLKNKLLDLLNDWTPKLFDFSKESELDDLLAITLTTALLFDYSLRKNKLDPVLKAKLDALVCYCQAHNFAFKTPFILSVLFEDRHSLLWRTLNEHLIETKSGGLVGAGDHFAETVCSYRDAPTHEDTYEPVNLDREKLLVIARVLSYLDGKVSTDQFDLCCALRLFDSGSIAYMWSCAGTDWDIYETWKATLQAFQNKPLGTSDFYFCN